MDLNGLEGILRQEVPDLRGGNGTWEFTHDSIEMLCVTDARFDRMRIISPVTELAKMTEVQIAAVLEANFHTALDARYATNSGVLYSAFIHPLSPLQPEQVGDALHQVAGLVQTFGTQYQSCDLTFMG